MGRNNITKCEPEASNGAVEVVFSRDDLNAVRRLTYGKAGSINRVTNEMLKFGDRVTID